MLGLLPAMSLNVFSIPDKQGFLTNISQTLLPSPMEIASLTQMLQWGFTEIDYICNIFTQPRI